MLHAMCLLRVSKMKGEGNGLCKRAATRIFLLQVLRALNVNIAKQITSFTSSAYLFTCGAYD